MIKFRAWIKTGNENDDYVEPMTIQQMIHSKESTFSLEQLNDLVDFEQFTGLKDVNGKKIYVGDIVQPVSLHMNLKRGKPFEVNKDNYVYGKWIAKDISNNGFIVNGYYFGYEIQVAGNVHEDPELLEAGK
ncbi:hypothetical protein HPB53_07180 [Lactiplantibacillus plantarum]|uniref:YopX family protein n=1 Tax=Lactiplantibacillus plantarum TaxID=1590 RepID=UPI001494B333|nr:YopX family protein [Lactiplantibacillus plantarum]QJY42708.1 hypothetical protein HPB53_07180 [Lactiplantibacillus plantarum]